ncbi:hypothetical protein PLACP1_20580 [Planifilum fimeticola]
MSFNGVFVPRPLRVGSANGYGTPSGVRVIDTKFSGCAREKNPHCDLESDQIL